MISGFLNLYKPTGWTSHDCIAKLRRWLNQKKVGHGGTLDPAAAGVLPVAFGRATRLLQYLPSDKAYRAVVRFGITTTTDDLAGEVLTQQSAAHLTEAATIAALPAFIGTLEQTPPRYSAVQVQGQRLYDLARQGKDFVVPTRQVTVYHIAAIAWQPGEFPELTLQITCGAGTYIRAIARDLGVALGVGATLAALTRTKSSGFIEENSLPLEVVEAQVQQDTLTLIPPEVALQHLPQLILPMEVAQRWQHGQKVPYEFNPILPSVQYYLVYNPDMTFLGVTGWETGLETEPSRLLPQVVYRPLS